jgi:hypothetical protein
LGLRPCLGTVSNKRLCRQTFKQNPKGSNQAAMLLKQTPKGSNHQEKSLNLGDFSLFIEHQKYIVCKKKLYNS